jgi:hypothetical protein
LDGKITGYFTHIIERAKITFPQVQYQIDNTPKRAILRLNACYGEYQILVTELLSNESRQYRYYV